MRSKSVSLWRAAALAAIVFSFVAGAFALDATKPIDRHMIDVWQNETGLPQNSVLAILQTRDGYVWLGTQEGLARFDGVRFTVFDRANTPAFHSNHVQALLEDRQGNIWVATYGGGLVRQSGGKFTRYSTADGLPHDTIRTLYLNRDGDLLIGTNGGLSRFRDGRFTTILSTNNGLASDEVVSLFEDVDRTLWVGTYGGGLHRWKNGALTHYGTENGLSNDKVWSVVRDREGNLWIGTRGGLNRLNNLVQLRVTANHAKRLAANT